MIEAVHYTRQKEDMVRCELCPHACLLKPDETGKCLARTNREGRLVTQNYGKLTGMHLDPVEKKPLYHFFPGQRILSIGSYGCNLHCDWCQNARISLSGNGHFDSLPVTNPEEVVASMRRMGGIGLAYTYNEPVVWFEFMMDTARMVQAEGRKNVMVTNGFINPKPMKELLEVVDALNVDLKSFSQDFYHRWTGGSLQPVKHTLTEVARRGRHLEVTFLVIPELTDDLLLFRDMVRWIREELGEQTVLHLSRYFPAWKLAHPPTPIDSMTRLLEAALEQLPFVYLGNVPQTTAVSDTYCPVCSTLMISRRGYQTDIHGMNGLGHCTHCGEPVITMQ
jgi:pyruvate formate lyase activating enzyme